jgi:HAD superfamily hydrolase (TIGR01459 family)
MRTIFNQNIGPLAKSYDSFIIDLWGTLHNGIDPFVGALESLKRMQELGKSVALLSNAPFRSEVVADVIDNIGIPRELYNYVYSSGEMTWRAIAEKTDSWHASLGKKVVFIGNDRHRSMLDNPHMIEVKNIDTAEFILCTGPREPTDNIDNYFRELEFASKKELPMVCANPDREVLRGNRREICAGAIAEYYEDQLSGEVVWHGKPFRPVFEEVLRMLGNPPRSRVLMIGDGIKTDIEGAKRCKIDSFLVCSGIHARALGISSGKELNLDSFYKFLKANGQSPRYAALNMCWG